jgi:hypothetical protein
VSRPALFVGSSAEGYRIAQAVQVNLDTACEVKLWTQGPFGLMQGTLESLVAAADQFDFAVLVLTADDLNISRGIAKLAARDNVLFELGLFIGSLGRDRTFIICNSADRPELPSDLAGVTAATFVPHADGNFVAALGSPCTTIQGVVERLGIRKGKGLRTGHKMAQEPGGWFRDLPDGSEVGYREEVSGAAVAIPPGAEAWIVVQTCLEPVYWPQRNLALDRAGNFRTVAQFGRSQTQDTGGAFILLLVTGYPDAIAMFRDSRTQLSGLPALPPGVRTLARVAVTRR